MEWCVCWKTQNDAKRGRSTVFLTIFGQKRLYVGGFCEERSWSSSVSSSNDVRTSAGICGPAEWTWTLRLALKLSQNIHLDRFVSKLFYKLHWNGQNSKKTWWLEEKDKLFNTSTNHLSYWLIRKWFASYFDKWLILYVRIWCFSLPFMSCSFFF